MLNACITCNERKVRLIQCLKCKVIKPLILRRDLKTKPAEIKLDKQILVSIIRG